MKGSGGKKLKGATMRILSKEDADNKGELGVSLVSKLQKKEGPKMRISPMILGREEA